MIPEEVEELIREGYRFYEFHIYEYPKFTEHIIRLHKCPELHKKIRIVDGLLINIEEEIFRRPCTPFPKIMDASISRQMFQFSLDYQVELNSLRSRCSDYSYMPDYFRRTLMETRNCELIKFIQGDFEKEESKSKLLLSGIDFPHIIAPVSGIILEYAQYSLYEFLVYKFETRIPGKRES